MSHREFLRRLRKRRQSNRRLEELPGAAADAEGYLDGLQEALRWAELWEADIAAQLAEQHRKVECLRRLVEHARGFKVRTLAAKYRR